MLWKVTQPWWGRIKGPPMTVIYDDISEESQKHLETKFWWIAGNGGFATIPEFPGTDCHRVTIRILTSMLWNRDPGQDPGISILVASPVRQHLPLGEVLKVVFNLTETISTCLLRPKVGRKGVGGSLLQNTLWRWKISLRPLIPALRGHFLLGNQSAL